MTEFLKKNFLVFLIFVLGGSAGVYLYKKETVKEDKIPPSKFEKQLATITMFSKSTCIYCLRAKNYLKEKALEYKEIDLQENPEALKELQKLMKRVTVPQIFIGDYHVGGYSDLIKLSNDELKKLLYYTED